jgi:hypothetical protein
MTTLQPAPQGAQAVTNTLTLDKLLERATELGEQAGKGKDTQIKFLLSAMEGGYFNAIDMVPNKHGSERDDAVRLAETYVKAQGTATVFDAKAGNQRKLISTLRTSIKLGQWPKGGNGEPLGTVNNLMTERQKLRKDPTQCKKLDDAANTFLRFARAQLKRDVLIEPAEFKTFLMKPTKDLLSAEEVLDGIRKSLQKLAKGEAQNGTVQDNSKEVRDALSALNQRMSNIAKGKAKK